MAASLLQIGPYPIGAPRHGGQIRVRRIHDRLRELGFAVDYLPIYAAGNYEGDAEGDLTAPPDSPHLAERSPFLWDFCSALHFAEAEPAFRNFVRRVERAAPDIIVIEQPWGWLPVRRWLATAKRRPQLWYSSQNIEHTLKAESVGKNQAELRLLDAICDLERDLAATADHCIAVSEHDKRALLALGARDVVVAPNGVARRSRDEARILEWRRHLDARFALFVGSAHPPNNNGFWSVFDRRLGFLRPDELIVAVGGVSTLMRHDPRFKGNGALAEARIRFAGVVDDADLAALVAGADVIILPITEGGGTNLKTAEAIASGRPVVGTARAFRGYEFAKSLQNIRVSDDFPEFRAGVRQFLDMGAPDSIDGQDLRRRLYWEETLRPLDELAATLGA